MTQTNEQLKWQRDQALAAAEAIIKEADKLNIQMVRLIELTDSLVPVVRAASAWVHGHGTTDAIERAVIDYEAKRKAIT